LFTVHYASVTADSASSPVSWVAEAETVAYAHSRAGGDTTTVTC